QKFMDDVLQVESGKLDPHARDLEAARALVAARLKKPALRVYDRILARRPDDLDALYESAILAQETGVRATAAYRINRFIELADGQVDAKDRRLVRAL